MKLLVGLWAFVITAAPVPNRQGIILTPAQSLTIPISNNAPYSSFSSNRLEVRMHNFTMPSGTATVASVPQMQVRLMDATYNAPLAVTDWQDSFTSGQGNTIYLNISGMTDIIVRAQINAATNTFSAEVWNFDGSGTSVSGTLAIDQIIPPSLPTSGGVGWGATATVDYVRWFDTVVPVGSSPYDGANGDLFDFEFNGALVDLSPQNLTITTALTPTYSASPIYPPYVSQGLQRVFNASSTNTLSGTPSRSLDGYPYLTYQWYQVSGPSTLNFSSLTSSTPAITGLVFGSYQIQLTVTDSIGQQSSNTLKYGSVFADANDVIIPSAEYITQIFGPMLRLGASPWPYFDTSNQDMADFFGGLQSSLYVDLWDTPLQGTINVVNGSATVTGTDTTFQSTFCAGGTSGYNDATLIVWYPTNDGTGAFGRAPFAVSSCESDTSLTLAQPYFSSSDAALLSYAYMDNNSIGTWTGGSNNANYYDNVMAFYGLYYRSGLDTYLTYAETLADRWYSMPWFDGGRASLNGTTTLFPRLQSLTGMILRAFDGQPGYWSGIRLYANWDYGFANTGPTDGYALNDVREQSYATAFLAMEALFDPIPANRTLYQSELETLIATVWTPGVQAGGNWMNQSFGTASWNGTPGTVTVVNGSTIVTGNGTNWQPAWFAGNAFWTAAPDGVTDGDLVSYTATATSPTTLTLNMPYQGASASGRGWETNNLVGVGTQPYMLGIAGQAFRFAYMATNSPLLPGYLSGAENWIAGQGYRPDARGLWYGRIFPDCEPISPTNEWCSGGNVEQSRFLSGEIVGALSAAYLQSGDAVVEAFGDNIFGAMFGGPTGGPDADGTYITDVSDGGWAMQVDYAKDFGFFYGFGGGPSWPAARLNFGTPAAPPGQ